MTAIDTDDLALLATGFEAALRDAADAGAAASALFALGWGELLAEAPVLGSAAAFAAQGRTGGSAGIIDDVVAHGLGIEPAPQVAVVLPVAGGSTPPGRRVGDRIVVDGIASARLAHATTAIVVVASGPGTDAEVVAVDAAKVRTDRAQALDPGAAFGRLRTDLPAGVATSVDVEGTWGAGVALGRVALAHELVAAARTMLDQARQHAVDRVQFGRPVASFQAVRHKLAEALVHIEGAAAVAEAADDPVDPLLAALAKSLAGQAARATATHAQQVLAGIGFTTDHPFQRWLKRALVLDVVLGSSTSLPGEIGAELLRRGDAPRLVELTDRSTS